VKRKRFTLTQYAKAFGYIAHLHLENFMARQGLILGANTITNLVPTLYEALDMVSRELVGFIPAVGRNSGVERVALNQTVNIPVVPPIVGGDVTPGPTPPSDGDQSFGNTTMTISKSRYWPVRWTGEEQRAVSGSGMLGNVQAQQFAQAFRAACNEIEADLAALYISASRAYGTAGTPPFGTAGDLSDFAQPAKILDDNGAPRIGRRMVLGTAATANLRGKQSVLFKVNESGTDALLREGIIGRVEGFGVGDSAQVKTHTKGTGAGYTSNAAGYAIGATAITLITGTGTVLAGDVVSFAGDSNKYVVAVGVAAPGVITLQEPGLRQAIPASATAMTIENSSVRNMFFYQNAVQLATRAPALPEGGDMADDRTFVQDPLTGLQFEVSLYRQYRQIKYEVAIAWGVKVVQPRHTGLLVG
jgi:hypothetical protein